MSLAWEDFKRNSSYICKILPSCGNPDQKTEDVCSAETERSFIRSVATKLWITSKFNSLISKTLEQSSHGFICMIVSSIQAQYTELVG